MNTKSIQSYLLLTLFLFASVNSMHKQQLTTSLAVGFTALATAYSIYSTQPKDITHEKHNFWITTSDDNLICLTEDILNQCERLKLGSQFYSKNSSQYPLSKICFTKNEVDIFINALQNPEAINYNNDLNTIMNVAEKFGAYTLYAHCISTYLNQKGCPDLDQTIIVPLLKELTHNREPDILLSAIASLKKIELNHKPTLDLDDVSFIERSDYHLVNKDELIQPGPYRRFRDDYKEKYIIFDKNKNERYKFTSHNVFASRSLYKSWGLRSPYLFKEKNIILFYIHEPGIDQPRTAIMYDFINQKELASFSGESLRISSDEKYIGIITNNVLYVYNIENLNDIKCKKIECPNKRCINFKFSFNTNHFITIMSDNINNYNSVIHYNLFDFDWNNEEYLPTSTLLKDNIRKKCSIKFCKTNNNLFIYVANTCLEVIDLETHNYNKKCIESSWFLCKGINLLFKYVTQPSVNRVFLSNPANQSSSFEIYSTNDLSTSLYAYSGTFNIEEDLMIYANARYISININNINKAFLLEYDAVKNVLIERIHNINGHICNLNTRGWVILSPSSNDLFKEKTSIFDNKGKKVLQFDWDNDMFAAQLSPKGHDLQIFKTKLTNVEQLFNLSPLFISKQKNNRFLFNTSLYTQKKLEQCITLYNNLNSQQYAFLDSIYSDCHERTTDNMLPIKKDTLLKGILNSFASDEKKFLTKHLKLIEHT